MAQGAKDSHLKNPPDSDNYDMKVARIRMKGFHEDAKDGNELDAIAVYPVNPFGNPIINEMQVKTVPGGVPTWIRDATANDSDRSFTVPVGKMWEMRSAIAQLSNTATVGNRALTLLVTDGTDNLTVPLQCGNSTASQSAMNRLFFGTFVATSTTVTLNLAGTAAVNVALTNGVGPMMLNEGSVIRAYDLNAIDPAADDLIVILHYIEYDA